MVESTQALTLEFEEIEEALPTESKQWGRLIALNENYQNVELCENEIIFGRNSVCGVRYENRLISGKHCKITRHADTNLVFVEDLSSNGTYLNGEKIGKGNKKLLVNGNELTLLPARDDNPAVMFIFQDYSTKKEEEDEPGGPQKLYDIRETLGTGNFAVVKLCVERATGQRFALKVINKKKYMKNSIKKNGLMDEVQILQQLQHPYIIGIHQVFDTEKNLYIVLELVTGGELFDRIVELSHFSEKDAKKYFLQMLEALTYLHSKEIAHRDLKKYEEIKLSDFGLSRIVGDGNAMQTMCGTPAYLAPEVITGGVDNKGYDKQCDLWSLGAILFVMLSGRPVFDDSRPVPLFDQVIHQNPYLLYLFVTEHEVRQGDISFQDPIWETVSTEAKDLIQCLLQVDPAERYDKKKTSQHPWITGESMEQLLEQRRKEKEEKRKEMVDKKRRRDSEESLSVLKKQKSDPMELSVSRSSSLPAPNRPLCQYGLQCYRKNPQHFLQYSHPGHERDR